MKHIKMSLKGERKDAVLLPERPRVICNLMNYRHSSQMKWLTRKCSLVGCVEAIGYVMYYAVFSSLLVICAGLSK